MAFFETLPRDTQDEAIAAMAPQMRQGMFPFASPDLRRRIELTNGPAQVVARDLSEAKILRAVYSNRQLQGSAGGFLVSTTSTFTWTRAPTTTWLRITSATPSVRTCWASSATCWKPRPRVRPCCSTWITGNRWDPTRPAARNPANAKQARRGLNENYGRELLELHTLGVDGGYTQKDVTEVARCFTGWTINQPQRGGEFVFNPRLHDNGEKIVLGVAIPAGGGESDGEKVLDIVAHHPSTAHFISRKLAQRFVADDPPASAGGPHGADVSEERWRHPRSAARPCWHSKEFWSAGAYRSKMKSPLEMVASAVRAVNGDVDFAFPLVNQVAQLGEPLYRKLEPTGYSNSSAEWVNSAGLLARMNFALQLADNKMPGVKVDPAKAAKPDDLAGITLGSPEFQKTELTGVATVRSGAFPPAD